MTTTLVRRDVWKLPAGDKTLDWYAKGVDAMKKRAADDPTSWSYQAAMHGSPLAKTLPLWKGCQHGSWWFVGWHRMYLLRFEQIVRAAVVAAHGPATWTLPYWDYTSTSPAGANTLPLAFRDPASPLYAKERRTTPYDVNKGMGLHPDTVSVRAALETTSFVPSDPNHPITGFAGQVVSRSIHYNNGFGALEQQPHNVVHVAIGGPGGLMTNPDTAAADPIFWLHHANIDRLWASWVALGGGRATTTDPHWTGKKFSFFDASGTKKSTTLHHVESTETLGYTYEHLTTLPVAPHAAAAGAPAAPPAATSAPAPHAEIVGGTSEPVLLTGRQAARSVPIETPRARPVAGRDVAPTAPRRVFLALDDITAEEDPGTPYSVYVNLPGQATPEVAREHLAGTVAFFGIGNAAQPGADTHAHPYRAEFDITRLVSHLTARGEWDPERVDVAFRPADFVPPEGAAEVGEDALPEHAPVSVGRISLHYA
jgi:tyrosinase